MKNIHILPTENSSRLSYNENGVLELNRLQWRKRTQNIYITNDEEIKEGDWFYSVRELIEKAIINYPKGENFGKIILTTDQDLIKDGVQAIDDEFLEWFVKNPSCEEVEFKKCKHPLDCGKVYNKELTTQTIECDKCGTTSTFPFGGDYYCQQYNIIIPKEEPDYTALLQPVGTRQETLEEAAVIYAHKSFVWPLNRQREKQSIPPGQIVPPGYAKHQKVSTKHFINGAKWQQERSYSEEEVYQLLYDLSGQVLNNKVSTPKLLDKWFEQFKKK